MCEYCQSRHNYPPVTHWHFIAVCVAGLTPRFNWAIRLTLLAILYCALLCALCAYTRYITLQWAYWEFAPHPLVTPRINPGMPSLTFSLCQFAFSPAINFLPVAVPRYDWAHSVIWANRNKLAKAAKILGFSPRFLRYIWQFSLYFLRLFAGYFRYIFSKYILTISSDIFPQFCALFFCANYCAQYYPHILSAT